MKEKNNKKVRFSRVSCQLLTSNLYLLAVAAAVATLLTATAHAQIPVSLTDDWNGGDMESWTGGISTVTLSNPADYLRMNFQPQTSPDSVSCIAHKDLYLVDGFQPPGADPRQLTNITFTFVSETILPSAIRVYVQCGSGRAWHLSLERFLPGESATYSISLDYGAGWSIGPAGNRAMYLSDIQDITWVGIYVRRGGSTQGQNYHIDDVRLDGIEVNQEDQDTDGDLIPDLWEIINGMNLHDPADAQLDTDGDGMTNYEEYRAGTDNRDAGSRFKMGIDLKDNPGGTIGVVIRWVSSAGRTYTIHRSTNLVEGFSPFYTGIPAVPPENAFEDVTATNKNPYFYKVEIE